VGLGRLLIDDMPRGPGVHDVVDNVMGAIEREGDAVNSPIVPMPRAQAALKPGKQFTPPGPLLSHGNYFGRGWTSGRHMKPGEMMRPEDFRVVPVDSVDDTGYWHDFGYNMGLRDMHRSLDEGYTNADALRNFHYRAMDDDRRFAQDIKGAVPSTPWGWVMKQGTKKIFNPDNWALNRQSMIDRIQNDSDYRSYLNSLPREQLSQQTLPTDVANELWRLERADRWRDQMRAFDAPPTVPSGVP